MCNPIFDYDEGNFIYPTSRNMGIDSDGDFYMCMGDNMSMDSDTRELYSGSVWIIPFLAALAAPAIINFLNV